MNDTGAKVTEKHVAQALIKVRAMDIARKVQSVSEIAEQQPILLSMVLAQRNFEATFEQIGVLLELLLTCWEAMRESGHSWPKIEEKGQKRCLARLAGQLKFGDGLPYALKSQAIENWTNSHPEKPLLALALFELQDKGLSNISTETEKVLAITALGIIECIAYAHHDPSPSFHRTSCARR